MINFEWYAKYFREYLEVTLDSYSKFVPPVFVNYYSNTPVEFDRTSFAGYSSPSDVLSPNKYIKFIGIPVFFSEQSSHPVTSFDVRGVVEEGSTFTVSMMASIGVKPKPDDHLTFPVFADTYSTSALYQVLNVEPALALSGDPMTEKYQVYRLTLTLDNNLVSTIESKVVQSYFYVSRYQKFLPINVSGFYLTLMDQAKLVELYLKDNRDAQTLLWYPYKLVDTAYLVNSLFSTPLSTYTFSEVLPNITRTTSILEALCMELATGSSKIERVEKVLDSSMDYVARRWWNRQCYITVEYSNIDLFDCLYGNEGSSVRSLVSDILQKQVNQDYTLIGSPPHPLTSIFNFKATWKTNRELPQIVPTFTNWFEALYYYSVILRILTEILT